MNEFFSNEEFRLFGELEQEKTPPASLEKKLIERLRQEQLIAPPSAPAYSVVKLLSIAAAAVLVFLAGFFAYRASSNHALPSVIWDCEPIKGYDLVAGVGKVVLLGELHGTNEAPGFVRRMICNTLQTGQAVSVCLELSRHEQADVDDFLASEGTYADRQHFLSSNTWARDFQDGRNSQAMFELIDYIRMLVQHGAPIQVRLIDEPTAPDRDQAMAHNLIHSVKSNPDRYYITLVGNHHNRIVKGAGSMGEMVLHALGPDKVLALDQLYGDGTAWVCLAAEDCGRVDLSGRDGEARGIRLVPESSGLEYHGYYGVGPISASHPAREVFSIDE